MLISFMLINKNIYFQHIDDRNSETENFSIDLLKGNCMF